MRSSIAIPLIACCLAVAASSIPVAAQLLTPAPSPSPPRLSLDEECSPTTFRPTEWVVIDCLQRVTNDGGQSVLGAYTMINGMQGDSSPPDYFNLWSRRDGSYLPLPIMNTSYPPFDVAPGETSETETAVLVRMSQGTFTFNLDVVADGDTATSQKVTFTADPRAPDPPSDLAVPDPTVSVDAAGEGTFDIQVTNNSKYVINDMTLTLRPSEGTLLGEVPEPSATLSDVSLLQWNLASSSKASLAPGETFRVKVTYGQEEGMGCGFAAFGLAVKATVGGKEQLYGDLVQQSWGNCGNGGQGGGGELAPSSPATGNGQGVSGSPTSVPGSPEVAVPQTGDGAGPKNASLGLLVEALAALGASLMALGLGRRSP